MEEERIFRDEDRIEILSVAEPNFEWEEEEYTPPHNWVSECFSLE